MGAPTTPIEGFRAAGCPRRGYDLVSVSLAKLGIDSDVKFKIHYQDLKDLYDIDPDNAYIRLMQLLGIGTGPTNSDVMGIIKRCMRPRVDNWLEFKKEVRECTYTNRDGRKVSLPGTDEILRRLEEAERDHLITNDFQQRLMILELLRDHEGVIYEERMSKNPGSFVNLPTAAALMITLDRVHNDLEMWNKDRNPKAVIRAKDFDELWDEVSQYADKNKEIVTTTYVETSMTKERKTGIHVGVIGQEAAEIYPTVLSQCKFRFSSKLTTQNAKVFADIGVGKEVIKRLFNLKWREETKIGIVVPEWCCISEQGAKRELTVFRPRPVEAEPMRRK